MNKLAILHEGNEKKTHDNELIVMLIQHLGFDEKKVNFYGMRSKSNFYKVNCPEYRSFKESIEIGLVEKVLFILDADSNKNDAIYGGYDNTLKTIRAIIQQLAIENLSQIYIMCDPETKEGYLESLILATIPDDRKCCIEDFLKCSHFESKENHKAILHSIYKIAYPQAPYHFAHHYFDDLKQKLIWLFTP
ncbi:DUF3226 domain-containing protein [Thioflexithrix psekupsensis]|uniref:DUF4276 family protein n=1 Tax=Thioflexithrix psekupsensis TaxID=1570016 RepID=A0A251X586_9GAMM|nr:hypothetical protein [Thioflexithrix psekupsensis]OUD12268.1 hypothetical protein TPSD3_14215 [Thioflexithrix psekupsensis]